MYREVLLFAIVLISSVAQSANFSGDPQFVAAAEKARVTSARFWTGKTLKDWKEPCPITWANEKSSGATRFRYENGKAYGFGMMVGGTREEAIADVIPHEVDHAVRATIIGHAVPRWLDEGSAALFESEKSRANYRADLLYGNLKSSVWDLMHLKEYPDNEDQMTALYSGSASVVEWMIHMAGPKKVLQAQEYSLSTPQQWQQYVGESINRSRQRYDEWFQVKYRDKAPSHPAAELESSVPLEGVPFADVFVAGDFECDPCHRFLDYAAHTKTGRKFYWKIHRVSGDECRRSGISVPMFVVNGVKIDVPINEWRDVDVWAAGKLGLGSPFKDTGSQDPVDDPVPVEVLPGVTMTPDAMGAMVDMLSDRTKEKIEDPVVNWSSIQVVIAVSDSSEKIAKAVKGPSMRAFRRLTGGALLIDIISEADDPGRFQKYSEALGLDVDVFHVSVLVPQAADPEGDYATGFQPFIIQKVELLLNATVTNFSGEKVTDIPVEAIAETLDPVAYEAILSVLDEPAAPKENPLEQLIPFLIGPAAVVAMYSAWGWFSRKKRLKVVTSPSQSTVEHPEDQNVVLP